MKLNHSPTGSNGLVSNPFEGFGLRPKEDKFRKNRGLTGHGGSKKRSLNEFHSGQKAYPQRNEDKDFSMVSAANESA